MNSKLSLAYIDKARSRQIYSARMDEIILIGSSPDSTILQQHKYVTLSHCRIRFSKSKQRWIVEDLPGSNGTYLNNTLVSNGKLLSNNDRIKLGKDGPIISVGIRLISSSGKGCSPNKQLANVSQVPIANSLGKSEDLKSKKSYIYWFYISAALFAVVFLSLLFLRIFKSNIQSLFNIKAQSNILSSPLVTPKPIDQADEKLCTTINLSSEELYKLTKPTTVIIQHSVGSGSGVVIHSDATKSFIITNKHVANGESTILVSFSTGLSYSGDVIKVGTEDTLSDDLALVRINKGGFQIAPLQTDFSVGESVYVLGSPGLGSGSGQLLDWSITKGIISRTDEAGIFQTDAGINPGNSGGPIFNQRGCLVGIAVAVPTDRTVQQVGFAITAEFISRFVRP